MKKTYDDLLELLNNLNHDDIFNVRRGIAIVDGSVTELFEMSELDDICYGMSLSKFLEDKDDDFDFNDDYFYWDGYGCICSTNDIYEELYLDEVADLLWNDFWKYQDDIYCDEVADFFEELENEDDEEEAE